MTTQTNTRKPPRVPKPFAPRQFTETPFNTAEDKAKFANQFVRFVLGGFRFSLFPKWFYARLCGTFGHIAEYDRAGFWSAWFATPDQQRRFLERMGQHVPVGQPMFAYCDVERELKSWVAREEGAIAAVLEKNQRQHSAALGQVEQRRQALRGRTHQRFTVVAKSSNTGSFGHRQYVLVAEDRSAYKVHRTDFHPWDVGQAVDVPLLGTTPDWSAMQCEAPCRLPDCPAELVPKRS